MWTCRQPMRWSTPTTHRSAPATQHSHLPPAYGVPLTLSRSMTLDSVSICTLEQPNMLLECHKLVYVHAGDTHKRQAGGPSSLQGKARACLSRNVNCKQDFRALVTGYIFCCCHGKWRQGWPLVTYICTWRAVHMWHQVFWPKTFGVL